jgi:hypothetical protein
MFFRLLYYWQVRLGDYSLYESRLAKKTFLTNTPSYFASKAGAYLSVRLEQKFFPLTNGPAYFASGSLRKKKQFYDIDTSETLA